MFRRVLQALCLLITVGSCSPNDVVDSLANFGLGFDLGATSTQGLAALDVKQNGKPHKGKPDTIELVTTTIVPNCAGPGTWGADVQLNSFYAQKHVPYVVRLDKITRGVKAKSDRSILGLDKRHGVFVYPANGSTRRWCFENDGKAFSVEGSVFGEAVTSDPNTRFRKFSTHFHTMHGSSDADSFSQVAAKDYYDLGFDGAFRNEHNAQTTTTQFRDNNFIIARAGSLQPVLDCQAQEDAMGDPTWCQTNAVGAHRQLTTSEINTRLNVPAGRFQLFLGAEFGAVGASVTTAEHIGVFNMKNVITPINTGGTVNIIDTNCTNAMATANRADPAVEVVCEVKHPNYGYLVSLEDLVALTKPKLLEVYNHAPIVNTYGDATHVSAERLWDLANSQRVYEGKPIYFGTAGDDAHKWRNRDGGATGPGSAYIRALTTNLSTGQATLALVNGNFYASTGAELETWWRDPATCTTIIEVDDELATIRFIGTLASAPIGQPGWETHPDVGKTLQVSVGSSAVYVPTGEEVFVRAEIVLPADHPHPLYAGEKQRALTQPCVLP